MAPEDEPKSAPEQTERSNPAAAGPRGRRSGRGRRGRGRRPQRPAPGSQPRGVGSPAEPGRDPSIKGEEDAYRSPEPESDEIGDFDDSVATHSESAVEPESEPPIEPDPGVWEAAEPVTEPRLATPPAASGAKERWPEPVEAPAPIETETVSSPEPRQRASPQTVQAAITEVNQVIRLLQESLDGMEEVLETLELAERQKDADEHEIESLRRMLRQFHRPRDGGQRH